MKWLLGLGLAAVAAIIWWWPKGQPGTIRVGSSRIQVEKALTPWERARGLSGRQQLAANAGMLFEFNQMGYHPFWMKGMNFPLDFIWISEDKVVGITEAVPITQMEIKPPQPIDKVLEVNSGFVARYKIKVGDKLKY